MRKTWLVFSQAVTVAVAVLFVVATLKPEWLGRGGNGAMPSIVSITSSPAQPLPVALAGGAVTSYSAAAQRASPAVVSITASKAPARGARSDDPVFQFFFGDRSRAPGGARAEPQIGLGSGVIVSGEGYLLTNNHVIEGADDIEVMLTDGRQARAKLVGTDPETDVAVLKIELDKLPSITFGDAEKLQVGDVVLAIGNPFDVGQTVTSGIVSALGRNKLGINVFENFIQTDAAINSRTGGSLGIGFAIPVTTARQVMEALIRDGQVTRGFIGIEQRDLTPEIAQTLNLPVKQGVLVTGVLQSGPASAGGLRPGDVVVSVAGTPVTNSYQLLTAVASLKPSAVAAIGVQRGDKALNVDVTVGQRPKQRQPLRREE